MKQIKKANHKESINTNELSMIRNALQDSCVITLKQDGEYKRVIDDVMDDVDDIAYIETVMRKLAGIKGNLFSIKQIKLFNKANKYINISAAGEQLLNAIRVDKERIKRNHPEIAMHPTFMIFDQLCNQHDTLMLSEMIKKPTPFDIDVIVAKANAFVDDIRLALRSPDFRKQNDNWKRGVNKNYASLLLWTDRHFDHCSKLMVVRVDLHYRNDLILEPTALDAKNAVDQLLKDMDELKGKDALFEYMRGYIIKREYGLNRGIHFHCMFIFNGHKVRQDINYGDVIGELWERSGKGKRYYYNCNKSKERYQYCGIGMVLKGDENARKGLKMALFYLAKRDYYIRLIAENKERNLRKSATPPPKLNFAG